MAFSTSFVQLANGSILAFVSNKNNETSFRAIMTESKDTTKEKKYNKKGGLFSFNVSEIVRFNFFFIHFKFSQETNKDYLYNQFVILLI